MGRQLVKAAYVSWWGRVQFEGNGEISSNFGSVREKERQ
jgi:hypothetical protein